MLSSGRMAKVSVAWQKGYSAMGYWDNQKLMDREAALLYDG